MKSPAPLTAKGEFGSSQTPEEEEEENGNALTNIKLPPVHRDLLAFVTLSWLDPLMRVIGRLPASQSLEAEQLPDLDPGDTSLACQHIFDPYWEQLHAHARDPDHHAAPSLLRTMLRTFYPYLLLLLTLGLLSTALVIGLPLMIPQILWILNPDPAFEDRPSHVLVSSPYTLAVLIFAIQLANCIIVTTTMSIWRTVAMKQRSTLVHAIFVKSLRLSAQARAEFSAGKINSLFSTDVTNTQTVYKDISDFTVAIVQIICALYFLQQYLGNVVWIAIGLYAVLSTVQFACAPLLNKSAMAYFGAADQRTKVLREFLYGIKVIKLQAIEDYFHKTMLKHRTVQQQNQIKGSVGYFLIYVASGLQKKILPAIAIIVFLTLGHDFKASMIFTTLGLFGSLIVPAAAISNCITTLLRFWVSYKRLDAYFLAPELKEADVPTRHRDQAQSDSGYAISLQNATFTWELVQPSGPADGAGGHAFQLDNLTLDIPRGALVAVVGGVGQGKSSFLSAVTGQMRKTQGEAHVYGSLAYCPQEPWIASSTIRDNIVLNDQTAQANVFSAVTAACLDADLDAMPHRLGTHIGEKGISLSGGQRARVALARAIARNADIYILDDPIAALDAHVGKAVFNRAICGALKEKTVLLVTHQLQLLPKTDIVIVLEEGRVAEMGPFRELMARPAGKLAAMLHDFHVDQEQHPGKEDAVDEEAAAPAIQDTIAPVQTSDEAQKEQAEDREQGGVTFQTLISYFAAASKLFLPVMVLMLLLGVAASSAPRIFLYKWSENPNPSLTNSYRGIYGRLSALDGIFMIAILVVVNIGTYFSSKAFHDRALAALITAPMSFFDGQPVGRILNRMTGDVMNIDFVMTGMLVNLCDAVSALAMNVVIVAYSTPISLAFLAITVVVAYFIYPTYKRSYIELKRLSNVLNSPLNSHVSESLNGVSTILAHDAAPLFAAKGHHLMDLSNAANIYSVSCNIWLTLRLEALASLLVLLLVLLASGRVISPVAVALGFSAAIDLGSSFNLLLIFLGLIEGSFNAVERLNHYAFQLPREAPSVLPGDPSSEDQWPTQGNVQIKDLTLRYASRPEHDVIKGLSLDIQPGEKIGIVGRTGSGKSTLLTALFRTMEPHSGTVIIDGKDVSSLQIIPQEPVLFNGTVRFNLDVNGKYTDQEIWHALEVIGLKEFVSNNPAGLDAPVAENGNNLSMGQRQLMCLGRSLLAKPKVLVMDEATASVDAEADRCIQKSIFTQFKDSTVLSIAHRLNTVAPFDRVLVLDLGNIAELDAPHVLLERSGSLFAALVDATGPANAAAIRAVAADAYHRKHST
ncbi:hypothetical protein RI367_006995 [Sorochytrium milnesiophthora]